MKANQPIKIHGGKHYLAAKLVSMMPKHVHYVEPFAGGLSVLLAKPFEGYSEVVNDIDSNLINFWEVLSSEKLFPALIKAASLCPFSQAVFQQSLDSLTEGSKVDRALKFLVVCRQSRQGLRKGFATTSRSRTRRGMNEQVSSWLAAIEDLPLIHSRLKRVVVFNMNATRLIEQEDSKDTLFYCDPPYLHSTRSSIDAYEHEMDSASHLHLLAVLSYIKGKFMLSGYPSGLYARWAKHHGFTYVDFKLPNNASSKSTKDLKVERVWKNF